MHPARIRTSKTPGVSQANLLSAFSFSVRGLFDLSLPHVPISIFATCAINIHFSASSSYSSGDRHSRQLKALWEAKLFPRPAPSPRPSPPFPVERGNPTRRTVKSPRPTRPENRQTPSPHSSGEPSSPLAPLVRRTVKSPLPACGERARVRGRMPFPPCP